MTSAPARSAPPALLPGMQVLERGWLSSNNVLFEEGDRLSVVDTGYASHARLTAALIDRAGGGRRLARIVNTHLHSDHVGGNARLARGGGVSIRIPAGAADAVLAWDVERLGYRATGQRCPRFDFDGLFRSGDVMELGGRPWQALAAPGHDPHMLMLFQRQGRILVSGDALWEDGFGAIFPELEGEPGLADQRRTLDLIAGMKPLLVIPGHGAPFCEVDAALRRAYQRLDALQSSPQRNARHVLKVLVKFWLLQVGQTTLGRLVEHFSRARYPRIVHERYFPDLAYEAMFERTLWQLCASGAAVRDGSHFRNADGGAAR